MNRFSALCLFPLLLGIQEVHKTSASLPAPSRGVELASALDSELQRADWNRAYEEWSGLHPEARCAAYRAGLRSEARPVFTDYGYCFQCTSTEGALTTTATFYPTTEGGTPACRLLEFAAWAEAPGGVRDARRELNRMLTSRLGKGFRDRDSGRVGQRFWPSPDVEVRSFAWGGNDWRSILGNDLRCSPSDEKTAARRRLLVSNLGTDEQEEELLGVLGNRMNRLVVTASRLRAGQRLSATIRPGEPGLISQDEARSARLLARLHTLSPEAAGLLDKASDIEEGELRAGLDRLLKSARDATGSDKAALLVAADSLAGGLHSGEMPDRESQPIVETIAGYRLTFEPDLPGDANWQYSRDLLWEAWKTGSGDWADEAFVELSELGWSGKDDCFREMIERGERFLAATPDSSRTPRVLFDVAQAYETWWSLSRDAGENGLVENPGQFKPGADAALASAIAAYERVQKLAPESEEAEAAQSRLFYLRLGVDTRERKFYCVSYC
jgi:hypothetical protein